MTGTRAGALKAVQTIRQRYGANWFEENGKKHGGQKSGTGGFAWLAKHDPERLAKLSSRGGKSLRKSTTE